MKKICIIIFSLLLVGVFVAPAMADCSSATDVVTFGSGSLGTETLEYGVSNNVFVTYATGATWQDYGLGTTHKAGNRQYGTTNQTTLIYYQTKSTGSTVAPSITAGATDLSGWGTAL